jgi:hypothetical protein
MTNSFICCVRCLDLCDARAAGREGCEPGGDGDHRAVRAARVHGVHGGVPAVPAGQRRGHAAGAVGRGRRRAAVGGGRHGRRPWRPAPPTALVCAFRRCRLHAWHDGHRAQPRTQRRRRCGACRAKRPPLRLRLLPPIPRHVRQRGISMRYSFFCFRKINYLI